MKKWLEEIAARFGAWWPEIEPAIGLAALILMLALAGCGGLSPYKPLQPLPGILTEPPADLALRPTVTDYDGMVYAHGAKLVLSGRVTNLERGDLALALSGSAIASGAGIASASGASAAVMAALISVGSALSSLTAVVNPAIRANALSEGNTMILQAESRYVLCISAAGITRVSKTKLTPCGAQLVADVNSAIGATNRVLVGLLPTAADVANFQRPTQPPSVPADVVSAVNKESGPATQP